MSFLYLISQEVAARGHTSPTQLAEGADHLACECRRIFSCRPENHSVLLYFDTGVYGMYKHSSVSYFWT